MKVAILLGVIGVLVATVLGVLLSRKMSMFDCADTVNHEVSSPRKRFVAAVVERDCGATTDYSTLVIVRRTEEPLDAKTQSPVFVIKGRNDVQVVWGDDNDLAVNYQSGETFKRETAYGDVRIEYTERAERPK